MIITEEKDICYDNEKNGNVFYRAKKLHFISCDGIQYCRGKNRK